MKKALTKREKVLLAVLAAVVLFGAYFELFFLPVRARVSAAQSTLAQAQDTVRQDQTRLTELRRMQDELKKMKDSGALNSEIPDYDNIDNVMVQLGSILKPTAGYRLKFGDPAFGDLLVSRPVQISFSAANYAAAKKILSALSGCRYRCALSGITVTTGDSVNRGNLASQKVSVALTVTFYEKYKNAAAKKAALKSAQSFSSG